MCSASKVQDPKSPFFSIVLPTYNRAHIISGSLQSVLNQSFQSWELLVIDDGSKDNTEEVVKSFKDSRIKYAYQENAERSAARNNGIKRAIGKYVCFLDSDDLYAQNHLEKVFEHIEENAFKKRVYIVKSIVEDAYSKNQIKLPIHEGKSVLETIFLNSITPGQFIIPLETARQCGFNVDVSISEDTEMLVRLSKFLDFEILDCHTLRYIKHNDNSVNTDKYNAYKDRKDTLNLVFSYEETRTLSMAVKNKLISDCYFGIYKYHKAKGDKVMAKKVMLEAIFKYPTIRLKEKAYLLLVDSW